MIFYPIKLGSPLSFLFMSGPQLMPTQTSLFELQFVAHFTAAEAEADIAIT